MSLVKKDNSSTIIINSADRISGDSDTDFQIQINLPKGNKYNRVIPLQLAFPKSYFLVDAPDNTFILLENGVSTTITMIPGDYSSLSFLPIMTTLLNTNTSQPGWSYTISAPDPNISPDTNKFTFTVSGNGGLQPSFIFTKFALYELFGFKAGSTNVFVNNTLTSVNVCKFQVEDIIYIHSDIAYNNTNDDKADILQEIYASSTPSFTNIVYQLTAPLEAYSKVLLNRDNNNFHIWVTNEKNRPIKTNGLNWPMTLFFYEKDNINEVIGNDINDKQN